MRSVKVGGIALVGYVLIVVAFESLIGYFQPEGPSDTLVLTTVDGDGAAVDPRAPGAGQRRTALRGGQPLAARVAPSRLGRSQGAGDARR